jgi:hypothetical protein
MTPLWFWSQFREWLVIENSQAYSVFAPDNMKKISGYIPRDVAERITGRDIDGNYWFTAEQGKQMRAHSEWRDEK